MMILYLLIIRKDFLYWKLNMPKYYFFNLILYLESIIANIKQYLQESVQILQLFVHSEWMTKKRANCKKGEKIWKVIPKSWVS